MSASEFFDTWAELALIAIILLLFALTFMTVVTVLVSRYRLARFAGRRDSLQESLGELVIRYASGDIPISEVEKALKSRIDYILLLELVNRLDTTLDGIEEERLQKLMEIRRIRNHFYERFRSGTPVEKAKACLYLSRKRTLPRSFLPKLSRLTTASEPFLAYSAATAIVVHGEIDRKREAIEKILLNLSISKMAVADLIITFTRYGEEYHREEMKILTGFLRHESVSPSRKALLIETLEEIGYFHSAPALINYYKALDKSTASPVELQALIRILALFGFEEILQDLHLRYTSSAHPEVRAAAAEAMGLFRNDSSLPYLQWLINDLDYNVRFEAVRALISWPDLELDSVSSHVLAPGEWEQLTGEVESELRETERP